MNVVIAGTGYVGLTTGITLAYLGHEVTCVDVDAAKIARLQQGLLPIYEPGLKELWSHAQGRLNFVVGYAQSGIEQAEVIYITVGTPPGPDGSPDLTYVRQVAQAVGEHLGSGFAVIVNKSTVPIGSGNWVGSLVRDACRQRTEANGSGDFAVASNPEFLREGAAVSDSLYPDRIVIGAEDERAIQILTALYRPLLNQDFRAPSFAPRPDGMVAVPLVTTDLASAELIKYAANAFLALKISYINEIAQLTGRVGADINQVARGIGLDERIGSRFLQAGIGWGGSCFGKDTAALISTAAEYGLHMPIVAAAREVNYRQREWVVEQLLGKLKILQGRTIALLGLAFKPHTDDLRDSPALDIARYLIQRKATVKAHDPVALERARQEYGATGLHFCESVLEAVTDADAIVLVTEWPDYRDMAWAEMRSLVKTPLVLDGRNFLNRLKLAQAGFEVVGVGR